MRRLKIYKKGFTLIELAIASSILTIIFGGMTIFGIQTLRSFGRSQALKNSIENVSYAIEILNRTIRTSHKINGGGSEIFILDNETSSSFCYRFYNNKLQKKIGGDSANNCGDIATSFSDIIGASDIVVSGEFKLEETDLLNNKRGFVTVNINLKYLADSDDNFEDDEIRIQSSVSLRDYGLE